MNSYNILVYIAGPFRAKTKWKNQQNIRNAENTGMEIANLQCTPIIPHAMYGNFDGEFTDNFWLNAAINLMKRCNCVVLCEGWEHSEGTLAEIEVARQHNLPVFEWNSVREKAKFEVWVDQKLAEFKEQENFLKMLEPEPVLCCKPNPNFQPQNQTACCDCDCGKTESPERYKNPA